ITPNPVKDAFQVSGLEGAALLSLTDTNGKVVFSKEITGNESISVSSLPQGLYIVKLTTANGVVQQKLIKQ
ncbi:MAG: T9SS type A sorting domain-containing protein, partial [Paludibacteraceae bacterium]|nr:T9SS type A sorting domain-containing protein [Paludibacteraceae bacterium]